MPAIIAAAGALGATATGVKVLTERALDPDHPEKIGEDLQKGLMDGTGVNDYLKDLKALVPFFK